MRNELQEELNWRIDDAADAQTTARSIDVTSTIYQIAQDELTIALARLATFVIDHRADLRIEQNPDKVTFVTDWGLRITGDTGNPSVEITGFSEDTETALVALRKAPFRVTIEKIAQNEDNEP